jgi:hypothetical protein
VVGVVLVIFPAIGEHLAHLRAIGKRVLVPQNPTANKRKGKSFFALTAILLNILKLVGAFETS